jgi:hypothetical protein
MSEVQLKSARTTEKDPEQAAEALWRELSRELRGHTPKLVTLFASYDRDHEALNRAVRKRLPAETRLLGASTAGEVDNSGIHTDSVILGALYGDFDIGLGLGKNLSDDAISAGAQALLRAADELGVRPQDLDPRKTVGVVIDDGTRYKKEELLLGVLDKCPALTLVGGGAASPYFEDPDKHSILHVDGEVATDATLVALFRTDAPWAAMRSHCYTPTGRTLKITKIDESCTRALEIDGQPAAQRYSEILGVPVGELEFGKGSGFSASPTALKVGREYFIRAPWKVLPDNSIVFANLLDEGVELEIMQYTDMGESTRRFFAEELPKRVPNPTAALLFHCSGRTWVASANGIFPGLSAAFAAAPPSAGFNVAFEIYCGFQINTTLTVLAFGRNDG